jgi:integrase
MSQLLRAHIVHLKAAGYSQRTYDERQRVVAMADQQLPYGIDQAATHELEAFLATPGWSQWTKCTYHGHLVAFYRWAVRSNLLTWDPSADLIPPRNPEADPNPVTDDELAAAMGRSDPWWQLVVALAAYGGLRASEIANQRRENVTADAITIHGKGNRTKQVPTHAEIWARVKNLPPGLLLGLPIGAPYKDLPARARRHFDAIGLPDVHLHRFRAWYGTALVLAGVDIFTVRDLMRHRSIKTTEGYVLIAGRQRRDAITALPAPSSPQQEAA